MHRTPSGDRRQALQKEARELARDARALQKAAARAPAARQEAEMLQGKADAALAEAEALKLQARLEDLTVWQMEKVKQSRKGSRPYTYWIGILARRRQDAQCAPGGRQEDGWRGGQAEGQGEEGGGAGDTGPVIGIEPFVPVLPAVQVTEHVLDIICFLLKRKTQYPAACYDWDKGHTYST